MKKPVMQNIIAAIELLKIRFKGDLRCIETGTIRSYTEKHESTRHISETLGVRGTLISIDNNQESIAISRDICKNALNVKWVYADSIKYLFTVNGSFHFAFLDSVNDKEHIFKEFISLWPRMIFGGVLIVDDAGVDIDGNNDGTTKQKGRQIARWLQAKGYVNFVREGHGTQLWIEK